MNYENEFLILNKLLDLAVQRGILQTSMDVIAIKNAIEKIKEAVKQNEHRG